MPQAAVCILASLISGVSAALILASGPSYAEARSPRGTAHNTMREQSTHNGCRANSCQIAYLNSVGDFCLWAPSQPATRNTEHTLDAWCTKSVRGARLIPDGTILGARLVMTPEYVQIMGVGNLTNINVPADGVATASEDDLVHGLVFTRAYGQLEQVYDWTSFVSQERFCFRACKPSAAASTACPRIHDSFGCLEDVHGNYDTGTFEDYIGTEVPLILYQEVLAAPSHYSTRQSSGCTTRGTISNAQVARARRAIVSMSDSSLPTLVTSFSHPRPRTQSTPLTSSIIPTATDTATTITFLSFSTLMLTTTTSMSSSTPVLSVTTTTPYSQSYTHIHTHSHSHHHSSTSSTSVSSSSSHRSFSYSRSSSSTASSLGDPSTTSSISSLASSTPSFTFTYPSSDPSTSGTSTSTFTLSPTTSFPSSSDGVSSSLSEPSSAQPSSSIPSSAAIPTSSLAPLPVSSLAASQSSDVLTFTTSLSSSSVSTTSPAVSPSTIPNSQTQPASQCLPPSLAMVNAGSTGPSPTPLSLMLTTLMIVISSSVGVVVL